MKFGKEFLSQMIPEWQEAYMDYNQLKKILKDLQHFVESRRPEPTVLNRAMTLYRCFSGLTRQRHSTVIPISKQENNEEDVILIHSTEDKYETKFLMSYQEGGEYEFVFFRRLDDEFNKVNRFYKMKMEEVMKEADELNKQMDALIALRIRVDNPEGILEICPSHKISTQEAKRDSVSTTDLEPMESISEVQMLEEVTPTEKYSIEPIQNKESFSLKSHRPPPLEVLKRVRINLMTETPVSTIQNLLRCKKSSSFQREELKRVESKLKKAFVAFYRKLSLLKSYSFLNLLAFSKIMKKYDKVTSRNASHQYLAMVDNSCIGSSDEVIKLMVRVENVFTKHFCNSNRRKGLRLLRPRIKKHRHTTTFNLGFMFGCTIALLIALVLIIRAKHILDKEGSTRYMDNMFPLYSLFGFIVLHMLMYAANVYFWRRYRVNYSFIFGFKEGTELGYREVLLVTSGFAVLSLAAVLANLDMDMDPNSQTYKSLTELVPLGLVLLIFAILFCPFNIIYRSSRFFLLVCILHCICAPLYKITLPDFFLADQLTSQVPAIRSLEFYICYYGWGDYSHRRHNCNRNNVYNSFYFIVGATPYMMRLLQCVRRLLEEKDVMHAYNGLKYFATIVAVVLRTAYDINRGFWWRIMATLTSLVAALVSTYWDLVVDWGLLQRKSRNKWLRDKLLVSNKKVYFGAMVLNCLLRFAWLQSVVNFQVPFLHGKALIAIVASLEIIRRGVWNFFRLENEHLTNVGKYRAFKSVPLPFNYDEDEEDEEDSAE